MTTALIFNLMCSQPVKSKPELKSKEKCMETKLSVQGEIAPERRESRPKPAGGCFYHKRLFQKYFKINSSTYAQLWAYVLAGLLKY